MRFGSCGSSSLFVVSTHDDGRHLSRIGAVLDELIDMTRETKQIEWIVTRGPQRTSSNASMRSSSARWMRSRRSKPGSAAVCRRSSCRAAPATAACAVEPRAMPCEAGSFRISVPCRSMSATTPSASTGPQPSTSIVWPTGSRATAMSSRRPAMTDRTMRPSANDERTSDEGRTRSRRDSVLFALAGARTLGADANRTTWTEGSGAAQGDRGARRRLEHRPPSLGHEPALRRRARD